MQVQHDTSGPAGDVDDVQVKSSAHTGAIIDTEDEEQETKSETMGLPSNVTQPISTPDLQLGRDVIPTETVMETPAASRHQEAAVKASPVLSWIAGNAMRGNDDSHNWGEDADKQEIIPEIQETAGSPNEQTLFNGLSIKTFQDQENDPISIGVPPGVAETVSEIAHEELLDRRDQTDERSQMSTNAHADRLLKTALGSQENLSDIPPSSPIYAPHADEPKLPDAPTEIPPKLPFELKPLDPDSVPESASKNHKRKRPSKESQDSAKSTIQVAIPVKTPFTDSKQTTKRRKPNPVAAPSGKSAPSKRPTPASTRSSAEPSPSGRSTRSSLFDKATPQPSTGTGMKILFASSTSIDKSIRPMNFLTSQNVKKAKSVADCDVLCVGKGDLKKTSNLVMAVLHGKQIITDDWVVRSATEGELLDIHDYLARDPGREAEWRTNLSEAIQRGKENVKPLLDWTIHFTTTAKKELGKGFSELKEIALLAGAKSVQANLPKKSNKGVSLTIIIAAHNDADLSALEEGGWRSFSKDIIALSVLRGVLDTDNDEFLVTTSKGELPSAGTASKKRKK